MTSTDTAARPPHWKWLVCGLLLFASMLLYMDRQTLPNVATRITTEFQLKQEQYGAVEMWFGYAFAFGAFLWGCVADKWSVRWLYPALSTRFHLAEWHRTIDEKLRTLDGLYQLLKTDQNNRWMLILEVTIVLLFVLDLVLLFVVKK